MALDSLSMDGIHFLSQFSWSQVGEWFAYALGLFVYIWLIWHFYRFVAKRDIFEKHLSIHHEGLSGFFEDLLLGVFHLGKYGVLFPLVSFLWFGGFVALLFVVAQNQSIEQITLISIGVVGSARMLAYYKEDMAQELAKTVPIVVLGIALVEPNFFELNKVLARLESIPFLWSTLLPFIVYLSALEIGLRVLLWAKEVGVGPSLDSKPSQK